MQIDSKKHENPTDANNVLAPVRIMATEQNIKDGHRYLIQLSVKQDSFLFNMWDYVESCKTLKEAEKLCEGLYDKSVHKLQISDLVTNTIVRTWT